MIRGHPVSIHSLKFFVFLAAKTHCCGEIRSFSNTSMTVLEQAQAAPNCLDSKDNFPAWPPAPKASAPMTTTTPEVKISEQLSKMPGQIRSIYV